MPAPLTPARKAELLVALSRGETVEGMAREGKATEEDFRSLFLEASRMFHPDGDTPPWKVFVDGASRGNPGHSAAGLVLLDGRGELRWEGGDYLGVGTNNEAEYRALLLVLEKAGELGARKLLIHSDSELLVRQMTGRYRVKEPRLKELYGMVSDLLRRFEQVRFVHIPREKNRRADMLANRALDEYIGGQR